MANATNETNEMNGPHMPGDVAYIHVKGTCAAMRKEMMFFGKKNKVNIPLVDTHTLGTNGMVRVPITRTALKPMTLEQHLEVAVSKLEIGEQVTLKLPSGTFPKDDKWKFPGQFGDIPKDAESLTLDITSVKVERNGTLYEKRRSHGSKKLGRMQFGIGGMVM